MIKTGVYKNTDAQIYNWPPLGVWFEVCEEECQLEELWAPLGPLKVVSAITFLLFPSLPCASVSVFICGQSLITKSSGSCVAGELPPVLAPWDLAGNTSTYLQSYFAIIGCPESVIILSALNLLWRGHYTAPVYVWNKILIYKRDMADTFYYESLPLSNERMGSW